MAKIHSGFTELKQAHNSLLKASQLQSGSPSHLLLFYATECGLKCAYLRSNNLNSTDKLEATTHDLVALIKALRLPKQTVDNLPILRLKRDRTKLCPHSDAHQAWRYGIRLGDPEETQFVNWLGNICAALKEYL